MRQTMYITDFTVEGRGDFPLDMLRYDQCWPADSAAVTAIETTYGSELERHGSTVAQQPGLRRIRLRKVSGSGIGPTEGRWNSFGWRVVETD